jgi:hypothetical protein
MECRAFFGRCTPYPAFVGFNKVLHASPGKAALIFRKK